MLYRITHITSYHYYGKVSMSHNEARLIPRNLPGQECKHCVLSVDPWPRVVTERQDFFGNNVHYFCIEKPENEMKVTSVSTVLRKHKPYEPDIPGTINWEAAFQKLKNNPSSYLYERQFLFESPLIASRKEIGTYAISSFPKGRPIFDAIQDLMSRIHHDFDFVPGFTTVSTPLMDVLNSRKGVCQDFAHLGIACLRQMGIPARYVSGYIETVPPEGKARLTGADASHAWISVYIPDSGWIDFDPTNNQMINDKYITIAYGRDYSDVVPLKGVIYSSGGHHLSISVDVLRLEEKLS